jgi:hypothetical protein
VALISLDTVLGRLTVQDDEEVEIAIGRGVATTIRFKAAGELQPSGGWGGWVLERLLVVRRSVVGSSDHAAVCRVRTRPLHIMIAYQ